MLEMLERRSWGIRVGRRKLSTTHLVVQLFFLTQHSLDGCRRWLVSRVLKMLIFDIFVTVNIDFVEESIFRVYSTILHVFLNLDT